MASVAKQVSQTVVDERREKKQNTAKFIVQQKEDVCVWTAVVRKAVGYNKQRLICKIYQEQQLQVFNQGLFQY